MSISYSVRLDRNRIVFVRRNYDGVETNYDYIFLDEHDAKEIAEKLPAMVAKLYPPKKRPLWQWEDGGEMRTPVLWPLDRNVGRSR